ncbi:MarR family transcriptional regulator [Rhodococcus sp. G-MC3]|uniref:MarR family winged helix-turn-helix transcriptional regulator n=1 Tax=Rhodococcus sp. G-MC3 TaxID=3046209 RepID=UPI0024B91EB8|nr:MarR family transcriptional regulator [Rhodococcus sp. G-MC3]MDJ0395632.1 MarR family transcriptional regulator [Rhodococcus sp. G-MC3]
MTAETLRTRTCRLWNERRPEVDTSPMEVVAQVKRITSLLELAVEPIYREAGVTSSEVELLVPLRHTEEPVTAIRLAELLGMTRAGVSKTLAKMERRNLIVRVTNPADRRSSLIKTTVEGNRIVDDVFPRELEAHGNLFAGLGEERRAVLDALDRLAVTMETRLDVAARAVNPPVM